MAIDKTIKRQERSTPEDANNSMNPEPTPLLEQAMGFAQVAREARQDCERGAAAEEQLKKRRNRSGQ